MQRLVSIFETEVELEQSTEELSEICLWVRRKVLEMAVRANSGHISTAFSQTELLVALYFGGILKYDPKNPKWPGRDRFILSKGQGGIGLYPVLARAGYFPEAELDIFAKRGSILGVHAEWNIPGIEVITGSLGHGLPMATGMALAAKADGRGHFIYCLLGDGELYEGSNWEAMFTAGHHKLGHLICIVDRNWMATIGRTDEVKTKADGPRIEPLEDKFRSFGFDVRRINGNDLPSIFEALSIAGVKECQDYLPHDFELRELTESPYCLIADTVKGKGARIMEDQSFFPNHYRIPKGEDLKSVLADLGLDPEQFKAEVAVDVGY